MANSIFINYRRADSQHAAFAIADRLRWAFGADEVFFDRGSIRPGNQWPVEIKRALEAAKVLIVIIGKKWLSTADQWARRRIDDPNDWVRCEICTALPAYHDGRTHIIPVVLDGAQQILPEALDAPLQALTTCQSIELDDPHWERAIEDLIVEIAKVPTMHRVKTDGDRNPNGSPARPPMEQSAQLPLSDAQIRTYLEPLTRWELQVNPHPWGVGGKAQEIAKSYEFASFADAIAFMASSSKEIDAWVPPHHPRWENQWKVVNVFFSTWDVDCRVTKLDIDAAKKLDSLYLRKASR